MRRRLWQKYAHRPGVTKQMTQAPGFFPCLLSILGNDQFPHSLKLVGNGRRFHA